jgi:hypothetical protein
MEQRAVNAFGWTLDETKPCARGSMLLIRFAIAVWAAMLFGATGPALAGETHVFMVGLLGDPEVGCIVTTPDGACAKDRLSGTLIPDGSASFEGDFYFNLPGLRDSVRQPLRRVGRGLLEGVFTPADGKTSMRCVVRGRVRAQGIFLPAGSSAQRFHTGNFDGRGRCGSERVRLRAIWSGAVGPVSDPMILDFERFQGRLAGTLLFR